MSTASLSNGSGMADRSSNARTKARARSCSRELSPSASPVIPEGVARGPAGHVPAEPGPSRAGGLRGEADALVLAIEDDDVRAQDGAPEDGRDGHLEAGI